MSLSYNVTLQEGMSNFFLYWLTQSLKATGFEEVASLSNLTGPRVCQFRRGPGLLTLFVSAEKGEREKVALSSETPGLESDVSAALMEAARQFLKECYE